MSCQQDSDLRAAGIVWDWFRLADASFTYYLLTHAHMDHMRGLKTKIWQRNSCPRRIYCTHVTKRLTMMTLPQLCEENFVTLEYNTRARLTDTIDVWALPSYHCDGSCMFLFEIRASDAPLRILYTGDFRFCGALRANSLLTKWPIHRMYYDNTFDQITQPYPSFQDTVQALSQAIFQHKSATINSSILGLEPLLRDIAQQHNVVFGLSPGLAGTYRAQQLQYLLGEYLDTTQPTEFPYVLGHRRKDDSKQWVIPTCTFFLCSESFKRDKSQSRHMTYVQFCTHSNQIENNALKVLVSAHIVKSCRADLEALQCTAK